jgi:hypothetical protein
MSSNYKAPLDVNKFESWKRQWQWENPDVASTPVGDMLFESLFHIYHDDKRSFDLMVQKARDKQRRMKKDGVTEEKPTPQLKIFEGVTIDNEFKWPTPIRAANDDTDADKPKYYPFGAGEGDAPLTIANI